MSDKLLISEDQWTHATFYNPDTHKPVDFQVNDGDNTVSMARMADALIEIAVRNGPRKGHGWADWDPVESEGTGVSADAYCTASRVLGIL